MNVILNFKIDHVFVGLDKTGIANSWLLTPKAKKTFEILKPGRGLRDLLKRASLASDNKSLSTFVLSHERPFFQQQHHFTHHVSNGVITFASE
jgi:hypothetical protein